MTAVDFSKKTSLLLPDLKMALGPVYVAVVVVSVIAQSTPVQKRVGQPCDARIPMDKTAPL